MNSAILKTLVTTLLIVSAAITAPAQESVKDASELVQVKSVFEEPLHPPYTDPFFPQSKRMPYRAEPVAPTGQPQVATIDQVILKGVGGTDGKRFALINRKTFEVGESGTVQTPRGPINIEVLEVKENSAVIKVENDPEPKEIYLSPEP